MTALILALMGSAWAHGFDADCGEQIGAEWISDTERIQEYEVCTMWLNVETGQYDLRFLLTDRDVSVESQVSEETKDARSADVADLLSEWGYAEEDMSIATAQVGSLTRGEGTEGTETRYHLVKSFVDREVDGVRYLGNRLVVTSTPDGELVSVYGSWPALGADMVEIDRSINLDLETAVATVDPAARMTQVVGHTCVEDGSIWSVEIVNEVLASPASEEGKMRGLYVLDGELVEEWSPECY